METFELSELVDELARSSDEEGPTDSDGKRVQSALRSLGSSDSLSQGGPSLHVHPGERVASAFWRHAQASGFSALCDALTFCGLRDELPRLMGAGVTVLAPTDEAFALLDESSRRDPRLVRQLLLGHLCSGISDLAAIRAKSCAVALAGQTHAVSTESGHTCVGTSRVGRTDMRFDGGILHEVGAVLLIVSLARDSHAEQVWKKSLQPSPVLSVVGGLGAPSEYEIHGCLLHAATGQLVPEALRGHVRTVNETTATEEASSVPHLLTFSEITVMTKPPSLAKRRGVAGSPDGSNRYRLLFSVWNTSSLSYVSWQVTAMPPPRHHHVATMPPPCHHHVTAM